MNLKKVFVLSLVFLLASQTVFSCPFPQPSFYSLKETKSDQVVVMDSNDDWASFLPDGDLKKSYLSSFDPFSNDNENAYQAYLTARVLEDKGQYKEAAEIYRRIDKARKSIWEWAGIEQIPIWYEAPADAGEKKDSGEDSSSDSQSFLPQAGPWRVMEASYIQEADAAIAVKKMHHKRAKRAGMVPTEQSPDGNYPAFQVTGLEKPPTGAWEWLRGTGDEESAKDFRLSFQEAANRIDIYSEKFLKDPKGMAEYIKARQAFLDKKYQDCLSLLTDNSANGSVLQQADEELKFLCELRMAVHPDDIKDKIAGVLSSQDSPRLLLNIGLAYLNDETLDGTQKKAEKYFSKILTSYPKSRYSDDACYLLAKIEILQRNWTKARSAFRKLGNKFNNDDIVAFGGLASLASLAKSNFNTPTLENAFWKLAGGPGVYDSDKSNLELISPAFRPYLMLWRSERTNDDSTKCQLLEKIAKNKNDSCIRRESLYLLATKYRLENQLGYGQKGPGQDKVKDFSFQFLESYPEDPRAPYLLSESWGFFPDSHFINQRLAKVIEKMSLYHNLPSLNPFGTRKSISLPPFEKNETLNVKCFIDSNRFIDVVELYPKSPWAFPSLIQVSIDDHQAPEALRALEKYQEWSEGQPDFNKEWKDILKIKLAVAEMMNRHWEKALDDADRFLGTRRPNRFMDEALWVRAQCLEKLGRTTQAEKTYESLVNQFPNGAEAKDFEELFSFGQEPPPPSRGDKASPYSLFAYQKVCEAMEKAGNWDKALDIYFKLGYRRDLALTLDFEMPVDDLAKYVKDHPDLPQNELLHYSLAMRYFRQNDFADALNLLPETPVSSGVTLTPTPGSHRRRRQGDEVVASNAEELRNSINLTKTYYDALGSAQTDNSKSFAVYDLGRFFFYRGRVLYYNPLLWNQLWFNDSEAPLDNQKPANDSYHLPFLHYRDAGYQFYQIVKNYPQSPMADRALYSYALCQMKSIYSNDRYVATDYPVTNISDLFYQVTQQYPQSPLADDALFWAGYKDPDHLDKYYSELLKNYPDGDVLKFYPPDQLLKAMKTGVRPGWSPSPFAIHNRRLRSPLKAVSQPVLTSTAYSGKIEPGKPYSGWLYYLSPGGLESFRSSFHMDFKGLDDTTVEVNFDGKSLKLPAGKQKIFAIQDQEMNWPPNVTKWVYFNIESMPSGPVEAVHFAELKNSFGLISTDKSVITLNEPSEKLTKLTLSKAGYPMPDFGKGNTFKYQIAQDGKVLWSVLKSGTGNGHIILCGSNGAPMHSAQVSWYNFSSDALQWLSDDSCLFYFGCMGDFAETTTPMFQWYWHEGESVKDYFHPKRERCFYNLHYLPKTGEIIELKGQILGKLPNPIPIKALQSYKQVRPIYEDTPNELIKEVEITDGKELGFNQDDVKFNLETDKQFLWVNWLGKDSANRIYFWIAKNDSRESHWIIVLDPSGKLISSETFPLAEMEKPEIIGASYYGQQRFSFSIMPSGGVLREYFVETPQPELMVDKLAF